jgi:hypothetical protein
LIKGHLSSASSRTHKNTQGALKFVSTAVICERSEAIQNHIIGSNLDRHGG